jgi:hypothetical protein
MEFNGFVGSDFDFFKKKDKLDKEAYERGRNEVKVHFRGLCYEIQKIYHTKTGGVLELQKDFQNFNRRSNNIFVEHNSKNYKVIIALNGDSLDIELICSVSSTEEGEMLLKFLKERKNVVWEYLMSGKHMHLYLEEQLKSRKNRIFSFNSIEMNGKSYESIINFIEEKVKQNKHNITFAIGYSFNKKECLRQGKGLLGTAYDTTMKMMELKTKLG